MSTKTYDELHKDYRLARSGVNTVDLAKCAQSLEDLGTDEGRAMSLRAFGTCFLMKGEHAKALECYNEAIEQFTLIEDLSNLGGVTSDIGLVHWEMGEYTIALEYLHKGLGMLEEAGELEGVGAVTNNIGIIFAETGELPKALEYYHKALALHREVGNRFFEANTLGNIALIYSQTGDYEKALELAQRSLALQTELGNKANAASAMSGIGVTLIELGRLDEAETSLLEGLEAAVGAESDRVIAHCSTSLANFLQKQNRPVEAIEVLELYKSPIDNNPTTVTGGQVVRAHVHRDKGEFEAARIMLMEAFEQASSRTEKASMVDILKDLRDLAKDMGDLDSYVDYNEQHQSLSEEVTGSAATRKMAMQEKEREIEVERVELQIERERERAILYGALPQHVADRLIKGEEVTDHYDNATVMFLDIVGFTRIASNVPAGHVVHLLEAIFSTCDEVCNKYDITKVKTIGDSYMAVAGIPNAQEDHTVRAAMAAIEIQSALADLHVTMPAELGDTSWVENIGEIHARVGLHCGPVVAGVVGKERLQYDVWGDTVNVASRMESTGEAGKVQISHPLQQELSDLSSEFSVLKRVAQEVKGKGLMQTYWLEGHE